MIVFGTRPEAIKMAPIIKELEKVSIFKNIIVLTGQHKEMVDPILKEFNIVPNYNLEIMSSNQTLFDITNRILERIDPVLKSERPDIVIVHGDTTTSFVTALAAFYNHVPIAHVEAGLRSGDNYAPFPEEFNRKGISIIANIHFAPTIKAEKNLLLEGISKEKILVTGNSVVDALKYTVKKNYTHPLLEWASSSKIVLLTTHRRENIGAPMINIFKGVSRFIEDHKEYKLIFPIHKNPIIRKLASEYLKDNERIRVVEPLDTIEFHNILSKSHLVLTDSGGIQEEAPSFGIPVLILRGKTERTEGVEEGVSKLVDLDENKIYLELKRYDSQSVITSLTSKFKNPYGDGKASKKIIDYLLNYLSGDN